MARVAAPSRKDEASCRDSEISNLIGVSKPRDDTAHTRCCCRAGEGARFDYNTASGEEVQAAVYMRQRLSDHREASADNDILLKRV